MNKSQASVNQILQNILGKTYQPIPTPPPVPRATKHALVQVRVTSHCTSCGGSSNHTDGELFIHETYQSSPQASPVSHIRRAKIHELRAHLPHRAVTFHQQVPTCLQCWNSIASLEPETFSALLETEGEKAETDKSEDNPAPAPAPQHSADVEQALRILQELKNSEAER